MGSIVPGPPCPVEVETRKTRWRDPQYSNDFRWAADYGDAPSLLDFHSPGSAHRRARMVRAAVW